MDENIYRIAGQIVKLHQKVYEVYLPSVEDVWSRTAVSYTHLDVYKRQP